MRRGRKWNLCGGIKAWVTKVPHTAVSAAVLLFASLCLAVFFHPLSGHAKEAAGGNGGYPVIIEDDAGLLTEAEEQALFERMGEISEYGGAAFKSVDENPYSSASCAERYFREVFGTGSGIVFLIDMDNRNIWIFCDGDIYRTIRKSDADTITDNVYSYASRGDYAGCAMEAFSQAASLLRGERIARPMKYICNALLAAILALLVNFGVASRASKTRKAKSRELLDNASFDLRYSKPRAEFVRETKKYNPATSSSGGGSGGGGGGGHSGGGGGHSF